MLPPHRLVARPAVGRLREGEASAVYVSRDQRATTERRRRILCPHHLGERPRHQRLVAAAPPRASRAFQRQALTVIPLAAEPPLAAAARNRLALRETPAALPYRLQGRM